MPAEITRHDEFGQAIIRTIRECAFESVLEIGSWDGLGSTQVLIEALAHAQSPSLVCIEANASRYVQLVQTVSHHAWVRPLFGSSITRASLTPQSFDEVWQSPHNALRYPKETVRGWWDESLACLEDARTGHLETLGDKQFDVVLVDGCEFTGFDDYRLAKPRTQCLMLDDVHHAYKCNRAHTELKLDPEWRLLWESDRVRNGASIWIRK